MMDDDAIKECGMHTAQEVVRNMGVSSGEEPILETAEDEEERRLWDVTIADGLEED